MVDMPHLRRAQQLVERDRLIRQKTDRQYHD
jgi:hypothetical protein